MKMKKSEIMNKAKKILDRYIQLRTEGSYVDFENYRFNLFEKHKVDDCDWDKKFMFYKNPRKMLLTDIVNQLEEDEENQNETIRN